MEVSSWVRCWDYGFNGFLYFFLGNLGVLGFFLRIFLKGYKGILSIDRLSKIWKYELEVLELEWILDILDFVMGNNILFWMEKLINILVIIG